MEYFVGLDISLETVCICILNAEGHIVRQGKAESDPTAIAAFLFSTGSNYKRIGLEAGPLSEWLHTGLCEAGLPAVCVESRHMSAALSAQRNKTDKNDAFGIAQMMRVGLFKPVHVKSPRSQHIRMLLKTRKALQSKLIDVENNLRSNLRNFGLKMGKVTRLRFEERVCELLNQRYDLKPLLIPMLDIRRLIYNQFQSLDTQIKGLAKDDGVCRLLMSAPGVGPIVALTYMSAVDQPERFQKSRAVAAHFGLTPARYQSGQIDREGHLSKCGDAMVRWALVEAAGSIMRTCTKWSSLKAWGMRIAKRRGIARAVVAVARRLAVILHRMWRDNKPFEWSQPATA